MTMDALDQARQQTSGNSPSMPAGEGDGCQAGATERAQAGGGPNDPYTPTLAELLDAYQAEHGIR